MHRKFIATGAILAGLAIAAGAFGAHGLQQQTNDNKILEVFRTAVQYQFWHAMALIITGILHAGGFRTSLLTKAAYFFAGGIILFSGSLYLITYLKLAGSGSIGWLGPITPVGGLCFITGWLLLFLSMILKPGSEGEG